MGMSFGFNNNDRVGSYCRKVSFQNPALTKDASNRVTWNVTHTLGATFIAQLSRVDGSVVSADIIKSNNAAVVSWNSDADVAANQFTLILIA